MDPFTSIEEMEAYLEEHTNGCAADTIAIARAQPLMLRRLDRLVDLLEKPAGEGQQGFQRKERAWRFVRDKLDEACWVRLYAPGDPQAERSEHKYIVAWR